MTNKEFCDLMDEEFLFYEMDSDCRSVVEPAKIVNKAPLRAILCRLNERITELEQALKSGGIDGSEA